MTVGDREHIYNDNNSISIYGKQTAWNRRFYRNNFLNVVCTQWLWQRDSSWVHIVLNNKQLFASNFK
jgi:hypothetical protein